MTPAMLDALHEHLIEKSESYLKKMVPSTRNVNRNVGALKIQAVPLTNILYIDSYEQAPARFERKRKPFTSDKNLELLPSPLRSLQLLEHT